MSKRYLTEAEAWERIAEAYAAGETGWGQLATTGVCWAISVLEDRGSISANQAPAMRERLRRTFDHWQDPTRFWWDRTPKGNAQRVYACLFLAILALEDAK